ncbi:ferritin-like domain-containing protein [Staphylospora marina]|uniref:ferritin-like domain-containing protein n=1 Tax=Staphylospora marina TaxID=2490858 RepID=UPI000F5B9690|nr:ferritin-like domain-containing protein [Staphylospora marina]
MQLTDKDLHYLSDALSWELLAMKKCRHYAQECQDPQVAQLIDRIGQMHQNHYEQLLSMIQSASGTGTGFTIPSGNMPQ